MSHKLISIEWVIIKPASELTIFHIFVDRSHFQGSSARALYSQSIWLVNTIHRFCREGKVLRLLLLPLLLLMLLLKSKLSDGYRLSPFYADAARLRGNVFGRKLHWLLFAISPGPSTFIHFSPNIVWFWIGRPSPFGHRHNSRGLRWKSHRRWPNLVGALLKGVFRLIPTESIH